MWRGRWPRRRLYYYTKVGSRDRGLVAKRGLFESLSDVNYALCEVKYGTSSGAVTEQSTQLHIQMVAATNYKTGDTKRRTDWRIMNMEAICNRTPPNINYTFYCITYYSHYIFNQSSYNYISQLSQLNQLK